MRRTRIGPHQLGAQHRAAFGPTRAGELCFVFPSPWTIDSGHRALCFLPDWRRCISMPIGYNPCFLRGGWINETGPPDDLGPIWLQFDSDMRIYSYDAHSRAEFDIVADAASQGGQFNAVQRALWSSYFETDTWPASFTVEFSNE
jgi:hypothetical protein